MAIKACTWHSTQQVPLASKILSTNTPNNPALEWKQKNIAHPISEAGQLFFTNAILDPAYSVLQKLEKLQRSLNPICDEARGFLSNLEQLSAKFTAKLHEFGEKPATNFVEEQARVVTELSYAADKVTLDVCTTVSSGTSTGQHYINR